MSVFNPAFVVFVTVVVFFFMIYALKKSADKKILDKNIWEIGAFTLVVEFVLLPLGVMFTSYIMTRFVGTKMLSYPQSLLVGSVLYSVYGFFLVHKDFHA